MSTLREETANGYDDFQSKIQQVRGDGFSKIWVFFSGALKPTGESWCDDCTKGKYMIVTKKWSSLLLPMIGGKRK